MKKLLKLMLVLIVCPSFVALGDRSGLLGHGGVLGTGVLERHDEPGEVVQTESGEMYENDPGILGSGGIAGTGVGSSRYHHVHGQAADVDMQESAAPMNADNSEYVTPSGKVYREKKGVLGKGGVAGTGIGKKRLKRVD